MRWRVTVMTLLILTAARPAAAQVDDRADELLRAMSTTLAAAPGLAFRVSAIESMVDEQTGKMVHVTSLRSIALERPGRVSVEEVDSFGRHVAWFDAGTLTVVDSLSGRYAVEEVPKTIDAMFDHLFEEHGLVMPIADLLLADPYAVIASGLETGEALGPASVRGQRCEHLAFTQEDLDWQIWIEERDGRTLPLKLVITYKNEPGDPQYVAVFSGWDVAPVHPGDRFAAQVPADAERVSLDVLTGRTGGAE